MTQTWRDWIRSLEEAAERVTGKSYEAPDDATARWLRHGVETLLHDVCPVSVTTRVLNEPVTLDEATFEALKEQVVRLFHGEPLGYIRGHVHFAGYPFVVSPSVLIPRPDSETLLEAALQTLGSLEASEADDAPQGTPAERRRLRILDLGTGSGALIVALMRRRGEVPGDFPETLATNGQDPSRRGNDYLATDISRDALTVARENARRLLPDLEATDPWSFEDRSGNRLTFRCCNLLEGLGTFDLIMTNPPYIATATLESLDESVLHYEPRGALDGGSDGLTYLRRIVEEAPAHLRPGGYLLVEHGYDQREAMASLTDPSASMTYRGTLKDLGGCDRVSIWRRDRGPSGVRRTGDHEGDATRDDIKGAGDVTGQNDSTTG